MRTAQQRGVCLSSSSFSSKVLLSLIHMWGFLCICWVLSLIWKWNLTLNKKQIAPSWSQAHFGRILPVPSMTCSHAFIVASENHFQSGIAPSQLAPETSSQINQRLIYLLAHLRHVEPISVSGTLSNEPAQTDYESKDPSCFHTFAFFRP